ncbi:MAG TPA: preprotein translocase subunit SecG [Elusimicrobia bacterium]|nr:MAG: preprotein translocase subunit SecG [Elusimicrobia bacterium RIFOXYA12_FULL_49_49]HBU70189.1 preprotein translocase subunit SecG [Elusimicrobiota bacterium]
MYTFILVIHILACVSLILIVLLQAGKGSGISGLFGGGGSDQLFSAPTGMAFIKKVTIAMAIIFMLTSLVLTVMTSRRNMSTVTGQIPTIPISAPQGQ